MSTTTLAAPLGPKKLNLVEGQYRPFEIKGTDVTVTVQCSRLDAAYTVTTYRNTYRLEDQCGSYPTEQEACLVARGYCQMFAREVTA
jgi:hypothetical protein